MFRWMRNAHLILGLVFFFFALVFALSSLVIIYRPFLPVTREDLESTVRLGTGGETTPRALALDLMQNHGLQGDLRDIRLEGEEIRFVIVRPGTRSEIAYSSSSGEAKIKTRRQGFLQMVVELHVNHGFWHEHVPSNIWSALSLLGSIGLFLLGATGIYLWFCHHQERRIGGAILALGLVYSLAALAASRMA